jgi:hypothetical protein
MFGIIMAFGRGSTKMSVGKAQAKWARSWNEESRTVAVHNPYRPPQLVLINTTLWWYYEVTQKWEKIDTTMMNFETWRLMMGAARRIETFSIWQRPSL